MARPPIAVATEDFAAYLDIARKLRVEGIAFASLSPGDPIPGHVEVVITTEAEQGRIEHPRVVLFSTPYATIEAAMARLKGLDEIEHLVIGVDPGQRPGIAVVADGHLLSSRLAANPEDVAAEVRATAARFPEADVRVRVGHGAQTMRDRIVNGLLAVGFMVEVVDETSTSPPRARVAGERDKIAARSIARTTGTLVEHPRRVEASPGEIRDIQRRSRLASEGRVTISKRLAGKVATGHLSLTEAVRQQKGEQAES